MGPATALRPVGWLFRWPYRVGQFLRGFRTAVDPEEARAIARLLSEPELRLFLAMRPRDRRHAAETMRHVLRIAADHGAIPSDEVLTAALLHDVGKGHPRVEDRVLYVILRAVSLQLVDRLATAEGGRWRLALWRLRNHSSVGAAQLELIGSAPRVVELTAVHHQPPAASDDQELLWLLEADEAA